MSQPSERNFGLDGAALKSCLWHSIDHATVLILTECAGAAPAQRQQTLRSILAHSGQNNADGIFPRRLRSRLEQHVDRGTMAADPFPASNDANIVRARAAKAEVCAAWRDVGMAGQNPLPIAGFGDVDGAGAIEAPCEVAVKFSGIRSVTRMAGACGGIH